MRVILNKSIKIMMDNILLLTQEDTISFRAGTDGDGLIILCAVTGPAAKVTASITVKVLDEYRFEVWSDELPDSTRQHLWQWLIERLCGSDGFTNVSLQDFEDMSKKVEVTLSPVAHECKGGWKYHNVSYDPSCDPLLAEYF